MIETCRFCEAPATTWMIGVPGHPAMHVCVGCGSLPLLAVLDLLHAGSTPFVPDHTTPVNRVIQTEPRSATEP